MLHRIMPSVARVREIAGPSGPRHRAFRALWGGQLLSAGGTQLSLLALPLLAAVALGAGPFEMGLLAAVETLPFLVLSLPAGVLVDRYDRRRLMILSDLARAVALAGVPLAFALGWASLPLLYGVAFVVGAFSVVFTIAMQAYVPELLADDELLSGNQRLEVTESGARVVGPSLAGIITQLAGATIAVALDALTYLASAVAVARGGRPPRLGAARHEKEASTWTEVLEGLRAAFSDRVLRHLLISTTIFNLASGIVLAQFVLYATAQLGLAPIALATVFAVGNVGFLVGALVVGRLDGRLGTGNLLLLSTALAAGAVLLIALAPIGLGVVLLTAGRFLGALSAPLFNVPLVTLRQTRTAASLQGRVAATFRFFDWSTAPIGAVLGGALGVHAGLPVTMAVAAAIALLSIPVVADAAVRRVVVRSMSPDQNDAASVPSDPGAVVARPVAVEGA